MNYYFTNIIIIIVICLIRDTVSDENDHKYEYNEEVLLWMNSYSYSLPLCSGPKRVSGHYRRTLIEELRNVDIVFSGFDIRFKANVSRNEFCETDLSNKYSLRDLILAVKNDYRYQIYIDEMPIWGSVGEVNETDNSYYLWTHMRFDMGYNGDRIVDANLTTEGRVKLEPNIKLRYSYEVNWKESSIEFEHRVDKYSDPIVFQHPIHWYSIFASFMTIILLVGVVSAILTRTLRKDYARYSKLEQMDEKERDLVGEYGWKLVDGDVFRAPAFPMLYSVILGSGYQMVFVMFCVIVVAILGDLYIGRGFSDYYPTTAIIVYVLSSPINGYFGGRIYAQSGGGLWRKQVLLNAFAVPCVICGAAFLINLMFIWFGASHFYFGKMVAIACVCIFVILPLTLVGTVFGRKYAGQANNPCPVNAVPRPIPEKKWFMETPIIVLLAGILQFGSIYIVMYFILTSFWAYQIYYVYGFMLLVFLVLLPTVTTCVSIVCTYFLLNAEDYRWQWTSFLSGASIAVYVFLYSFYHYYHYYFKINMYGMYPTSCYFGYVALFCLSLGLMCGTFGYNGAKAFVRKIYSAVKIKA